MARSLATALALGAMMLCLVLAGAAEAACVDGADNCFKCSLEYPNKCARCRRGYYANIYGKCRPCSANCARW